MHKEGNEGRRELKKRVEDKGRRKGGKKKEERRRKKNERTK
jgi:hypothetical protein